MEGSSMIVISFDRLLTNSIIDWKIFDADFFKEINENSNLKQSIALEDV